MTRRQMGASSPKASKGWLAVSTSIPLISALHHTCGASGSVCSACDMPLRQDILMEANGHNAPEGDEITNLTARTPLGVRGVRCGHSHCLS